MFKNVKIGTKILVIILMTSLTALLLISTISYTEMLNLAKYSQNANIQLGLTASTESQEALLHQAEEYLEKIAVEQAGNSNAILFQIEAELSGLKKYIEALYANPNNFVGYTLPLPDKTEMGVATAKYMLAPTVEKTTVIEEELRILSNAEYMFAAVLENDLNLDNIYVGTHSGISYRYSLSNAYNADYDPRDRDWFIQSIAYPLQPIWLDTYVDPYGSITVTCATAFNDSYGNAIGVIATDITLESLKESILNTTIGDGGYAFLLDNNGEFIAHPNYEKEGFSTTPLDTAEGNWKDVLTKMSKSNAGVEIAQIDDIENYIAYAPLETVGWSLGVIVPINYVTLPAEQTKATIDMFTNNAQVYIQETLLSILMRFIILFAVSTMILVFFAFVLSQTITKPLKKLVIGATHIGKGNLDSQIEMTGADEVGQLAEAFNSMARDLKAYISNLSVVIAEKERINGELSVAANIQNDMLPRIFPIFSNLEHLNIFAKMTPAKEVGGDFYDCFFIDESKTKLCCVIADVSGKGVPASLFMVIAKTILKTKLSSGYSLVDAIKKTNALLCEDNNSCMFVTAFAAVLDTVTGKFDYVNCGHNPPAIRCNGGKFEYMVLKTALPLAAMEFSKYTEESITIKPGDVIYFYTDGVTEAMNEASELFGDAALLNILNASTDMNPEHLDNLVRKEITDFVGDAEPSDDITTLALQYLK